MNVKVEAYLATKEREAESKKQAYRQKILRAAGLAEKVYSPYEQASQEFPLYDVDEMRYYKLVCEDVTDEEFERIEAWAKDEGAPTAQEGSMFANIGNKIKAVAVAVCWIGIIISLLAGVIMLGSGEDLILPGLLTAALGALGSWVSSLFLYGFGELIVKVTELEKNTRK